MTKRLLAELTGLAVMGAVYGRTLSEQAQIACQLLDQLGIESATVPAISAGGLATLHWKISVYRPC